MRPPSDNEPSFSEVLAKLSKNRLIGLVTQSSFNNPPYPQLNVDAAIQVKLNVVCGLMTSIASVPGVIEIDQTIPFQKIPTTSLDWLERMGWHVRRKFAPLAADYLYLFGGDKRFLNSDRNAVNRFYSTLIHWLLIETELIMNAQYYYGLGFAKSSVGIWWWRDIFSEDELRDFEKGKLYDLNNITMDELYGRIFYEYYLIMVRSQWDKIIRMGCMFMGLRPNEDSSKDGLDSIEKLLANDTESLNIWTKQHLQLFLNIAKDRLRSKIEGGWLVPARDSLIHAVGEHSLGVLPHKKTENTTFELWQRVKVEHSWLQEAMVTLMIALIITTHKQA